ncbi:ATP-binding protein [Alkaliphilus crotonatoxidans]
MEDFEFDFQPSVNEKRVKELMTLAFVNLRKNVILLGPPGVGKTY